MPKIHRHQARRHDDFFTTPLGSYSRHHDDAILTPGGRHVQRRTGLPATLANLYAALNGLGKVQ
jgi:hypothetical protein